MYVLGACQQHQFVTSSKVYVCIRCLTATPVSMLAWRLTFYGHGNCYIVLLYIYIVYCKSMVLFGVGEMSGGVSIIPGSTVDAQGQKFLPT